MLAVSGEQVRALCLNCSEQNRLVFRRQLDAGRQGSRRTGFIDDFEVLHESVAVYFSDAGIRPVVCFPADLAVRFRDARETLSAIGDLASVSPCRLEESNPLEV